MFTTKLILALAGPNYWIVQAPLVWEDAEFGSFAVPVGFLTDLETILLSIRKIPFLDVAGISRRPSCLHDGLYRLARSKGKDYADRLLRAAMIAEGASVGTAATVYYGVKWGGGEAWEDDEANVTDFDSQAHFDAWVAT